ncbi:hypothetical protein [Citrobacter braakii]|uniref:hypothetical protein n=1 Tax=Citrobacter braakii TaxID=57706 RepID=UPI002FDBACED
MSYFKRRDWFYGVLAASLLSLYFIFDVSIYSLEWSEKAGFIALITCMYMLFVQLPTIGDELVKQREINEKLNEKINDLKDQLRYSGNK